MIRLEHLSKIYTSDGMAPVVGLRELSLDIPPGEFVVIKGRSGSGKTTLLNLIAGLTTPTTGLVEVCGVNLWNESDKLQAELRNRCIGFVFQFPSLMPSLTVLENVMLPVVFKKQPASPQFRATELLELVGLGDKLGAFPRQLSAGQQQRVVIARALINEPAILIADEPTSNLDEQTENEIIGVLEEIHRNKAVTVLIVTHGQYAGSKARRTLEFSDGKLVSDDPK